MEEEFNLSEKMINPFKEKDWEVGKYKGKPLMDYVVIKRKDVKEFIRLLIPDTLMLNKKFDSNTVMEVIRILRERQKKLAGEKLLT